MRTIHKFQPLIELDGFAEFELAVPKSSTVRHAAMQEGKPTIWIELNTNDNAYKEKFLIVGTGIEIPTPSILMVWKYQGTFMEGRYVWHVYKLEDRR